MIERLYEIDCDTCGAADYFLGNQRRAEEQYKKGGGIVTRDKKHYCDKTCYGKREK